MKKLTMEQAVVISAYTGVLICPFSKMHEEIEKRIGQPVYTHMLGDESFVNNFVKPKFKDSFLSIHP